MLINLFLKQYGPILILIILIGVAIWNFCLKNLITCQGNLENCQKMLENYKKEVSNLQRTLSSYERTVQNLNQELEKCKIQLNESETSRMICENTLRKYKSSVEGKSFSFNIFKNYKINLFGLGIYIQFWQFTLFAIFVNVVIPLIIKLIEIKVKIEFKEFWILLFIVIFLTFLILILS